eukprot:TCONS_00070717-protein
MNNFGHQHHPYLPRPNSMNFNRMVEPKPIFQQMLNVTQESLQSQPFYNIPLVKEKLDIHQYAFNAPTLARINAASQQKSNAKKVVISQPTPVSSVPNVTANPYSSATPSIANTNRQVQNTPPSLPDNINGRANPAMANQQMFNTPNNVPPNMLNNVNMSTVNQQPVFNQQPMAGNAFFPPQATPNVMSENANTATTMNQPVFNNPNMPAGMMTGNLNPSMINQPQAYNSSFFQGNVTNANPTPINQQQAFPSQSTSQNPIASSFQQKPTPNATAEQLNTNILSQNVFPNSIPNLPENASETFTMLDETSQPGTPNAKQSKSSESRANKAAAGELSFKCKECGKGFAQKGHLKAHEETHSGIRPFSCDICEKKFLRKDHLKRHLAAHSGLKPFKCDYCGKCYSQKHPLKKHMLVCKEGNSSS